ncbi:uncharacterized protein B0T15DRAFT_390981 [Chaetomium strumarium]|uniref:Uncharacterized protein n=1 Tax=Chaetomium strumarium TaxID=1170767 RepID=A0AAJ0M3M3_9PEZI|nr:hypothetical protein B0T15DRAFT_390981 [Chaetomium strumarium]
MSNVHDNDVLDLELLDPSKDFSFPLYTDPAADPDFEDGRLRYQYEVLPGSVPIYHKEDTDSTLSVQRLLWADGWLDKDQKPSKEATLVVLKFVFLSTPSSESETKLQSVTAALRFLDPRGDDPEVVAWAPFHETERFNRVVAHHETANKTGQAIDVGYEGSKVTLEHSSEGSVSWDRTCFDEARVVHTFNDKGRPNGVKWWLKQNHLQNQGITPEFWAAILVSRASSSPYTVRFTMTGRTHTFRDFKLTAKEAIGLRKDGSKFPVTPNPGQATWCNLEGNDIIKCVDLGHLGKLVDPKSSTKLNVNWGPKYQLGAGEAPESEPQENQGLVDANKEETAEELRTDSSRHHHFGAGSDRGGEAPSRQAAPRGAPAPTPCADVARFTSLEARMAHLEARVTAQDTTILQLQQAQLDKDVQLFWLNQDLARIQSTIRSWTNPA